MGACVSAGEGNNQLSTAERRKIRRQLAASDPLVNVAADESDRFNDGFGILHNANKVRPCPRPVATLVTLSFQSYIRFMCCACLCVVSGLCLSSVSN